ncbi:MAG: M15 family metallopeptidase, partial [Tepidiformaceae bacterium]
TAEAEWLAANSWRFGFIVSYPEGKEEITGYAYEPWHIRYVGEEPAAAVRESGLTLHEYLLER